MLQPQRQWSAPFWFIGLEQGIGKSESDTSAARLRAWEAMRRPDICDCFEFHQKYRTSRGSPRSHLFKELGDLCSWCSRRSWTRSPIPIPDGFISEISGDGPLQRQGRVSLSYPERYPRDSEVVLIAKPDSSPTASNAFARRLPTTALVSCSCTQEGMPLIGRQSLDIR
jgi:hypothetical protein